MIQKQNYTKLLGFKGGSIDNKAKQLWSISQ